MDEGRNISRYWDAVRNRLAATSYRRWRRSLARSGMVTGLSLVLLVIVLAFAYRERGRGHLHRLESRIVTERPEATVLRPGGQEPIVLTRSRLAGGAMPEFLSVTLLPGRGMNILQMTAYLPDKGEVNLLDGPTVEQAAAAMTGQDADANGAASFNLGSPFESPWGGRIWGSGNNGHLTANWRGHAMTLPVTTGSAAEGGLLLARPSDTAGTTAMPDGGQVEATFDAGDFGVHWPSKTTVKLTLLLTGRSLELTATAHNGGDNPEPVGIGWRPRFAILGDRSQIRLRIPGQQRLVRERQSGAPTGVIQPVANTPFDFTSHDGVKLGSTALDDTFTHLHQDFLDSGPIAELRDPANNYGLRLTTLTTTIKSLHVFTQPDAKFISITPQFNLDDPFGHEWGKDVDTGMVVLQPGQTAQWQVRLELFSLSGVPSAF